MVALAGVRDFRFGAWPWAFGGSPRGPTSDSYEFESEAGIAALTPVK
jgi:hypothetical protein